VRRPRVGKVRYINCEPVYSGIEEGAVEAGCDLIEGTPAELNRLLGDLFVSLCAGPRGLPAPCGSGDRV
jgi:hypothetical protein